MRASSLAASGLRLTAASIGVYLALIAALTVPYLQNHVIYLHGVRLTWFKDTNAPEQWGFLRNQVTPFELRTRDGEVLHAWHVLPPMLYRAHRAALVEEEVGLARDVTARLSFLLLRDDPEALLVVYLHGAAGTLGSGWRPASYRALSAADPTRIHVVAIDYRGFGRSSGTPSEAALLIDARAVMNWALKVAEIPPHRVVVFGQSLGTAVAVALVKDLVNLEPPVVPTGIVLVAPFADVKTLTATYRVGGWVPVLSPLAFFPRVLAFFNSFIVSKWDSKEALVEFLRLCRSKSKRYSVAILHAHDDTDIPWEHSEALFWHAVNASKVEDWSDQGLERQNLEKKRDLGVGGSEVSWETEHGVISNRILKYGLHDRIMSYPAVSLAVMDAFENGVRVKREE